MDELSLMMTLKLNEIVTLNFIEMCIYMVSNIHFVEQYYTILLDKINLPSEISLNGMCAWAVPIAVTIIRSTPLHSVLIFCIKFNRQKQEISK